MNQLGCVGSGNKLQRERKGPWGLGERKAKLMCLQEGRRGRRREGRERHRHVPGAGGVLAGSFVRRVLDMGLS